MASPPAQAKSGSAYIIGNLYRLGTLTVLHKIDLLYQSRLPPTMCARAGEDAGNDDNDAEEDGPEIFYISYAGLPHCIAEIVPSDLPEVEQFAHASDLVLINGVPSASGCEPFGFSGKNCFTLESSMIKNYTTQEYLALLNKEKYSVSESSQQ